MLYVTSGIDEMLDSPEVDADTLDGHTSWMSTVDMQQYVIRRQDQRPTLKQQQQYAPEYKAAASARFKQNKEEFVRQSEEALVRQQHPTSHAFNHAVMSSFL